MFTSYSVEIGATYVHHIKSERISNSEYDRGMYVSQFPKALGKLNTVNANIQGLGDMIKDMQCDYSEVSPTKKINRIRYGQRPEVTSGLIAAGSKIMIWGIDDDE